MTKRQYTSQEKREYAELCKEVEESYQSTAQRVGKNYRVHCPRCVSSKTGRPDHSLDIKAGTGGFSCFRCGVAGKLRDPPDPEYMAEQEVRPIEGDYPLPGGFVELGIGPGLTAECTRDAREYMHKRRISDVLALELGVGACLDGYYAHRLVIPLRDAQDSRRGWVSRDYTGYAEKPYLLPSSKRGFVRDRFMFNARAVIEKTDAPLLMVEGVLDAIALLPHAVPVLGKPLDVHIQGLLAADRPIVWVLDGDAWMEARMWTMWLRYHGKTAGFVHLPPRKDPDELVEWVMDRVTESLDE